MEHRVDYLDLDEITPAIRNPKLHADDEIHASVSHFGLAEIPTMDDRTGRLVAGHGRINDLRRRRDAGETPPTGVRVDDDGTWRVPVLTGWSSRSDEDAEAYLVISNSLTTLGGWDDHGLATILGDLHEADPALLELTGFNEGDIAKMLKADEAGGGKGAPDDFPEYDENIETERTCPSCGYHWSGGK